MRVIPTVAVLLSAWTAAFADTDPSHVPSALERITIAVPHYAVLAGVCRTINGGSLHWNGRTGVKLTDYCSRSIGRSDLDGLVDGVYFTIPFAKSRSARRNSSAFRGSASCH